MSKLLNHALAIKVLLNVLSPSLGWYYSQVAVRHCVSKECGNDPAGQDGTKE